jgi:uncharacterized membrane-anchored protein YitT (DUF2179 family)
MDTEKGFWSKWGYMVAGIMLMAVALSLFFEPFSIILGGATGLGIIAQRLWGVPLWATNIIVNLPLFAWAYFVFDRKFVVRSAVATGLLSLFLYVLEWLPAVENDYVTVVVFGGLIYGFGIGLVLKSGATTGGSDLAAGILNRLKGDVSVSKWMLGIDVAIIVLGFSVFGAVRAMYGIIAVAIMTKAVDIMLEGLNFAKVAFIVCDDGEGLGRSIMEEIHRGVTVIPGGGLYTGREKRVLMIAASRKEIAVIKSVTARVAPDAFMFVSDIREIMGKF